MEDECSMTREKGPMLDDVVFDESDVTRFSAQAPSFSRGDEVNEKTEYEL